MTNSRILYCNCTYAQVVPKPVKEAVLRKLVESGKPFEAVGDLCEMSARRDPALQELSKGDVKIAACYPRAVKWLFGACGAPLNRENTEILNMRVQTADEIVERLFDSSMHPNVPEDKHQANNGKPQTS